MTVMTMMITLVYNILLKRATMQEENKKLSASTSQKIGIKNGNSRVDDINNVFYLAIHPRWKNRAVRQKKVYLVFLCQRSKPDPS